MSDEIYERAMKRQLMMIIMICWCCDEAEDKKNNVKSSAGDNAEQSTVESDLTFLWATFLQRIKKWKK